MDNKIWIYKTEYVRGTRTYSTRIDEEDLVNMNNDLKELATEDVPIITFSDLSDVWNNRTADRLEVEIELRGRWNKDTTYKTTLWEFISEYLRDWIYDGECEDDLELDDYNSDDDWSEDFFTREEG